MFHDPNFEEFINIVGHKYNPDLPLFSQLYILKQIMAFYHMSYSMAFVPAIALNFTAQVAYYLFNNRYMYRSSVRLFSFWRIFAFYAGFHLGHEHLFIKRYFMHSYKVNINDLFDQDEPFLF